MPSYSLPVGTSIIEPEIPSSVPTYVGRCTLISVDLERVNIAGKIDKHWISGIKTSVEVYLHTFGAEGRTRTGTYFYG